MIELKAGDSVLKTGYVYTRRAVAHAIVFLISKAELNEDNVIPNPFDPPE